MDDLLSEFQRLLEKTGAGGLSASVEFLMAQMEPDSARLLRLASIPHQFDTQVLRALDPSLDQVTAQRYGDEFSELAITLGRTDELALHDEARAHLFRQWLQPDSAEEFRQVNRRLVEHYEEKILNAEGAALENAERNRMFHLLAVEPAKGREEFERLFRNMRHAFRLSECDSLVNLVREYEPVTGAEERAQLAYREGTLAADRRDWVRARRLLLGLQNNGELPLDLSIKVKNRLALVHQQQRRHDEAVQLLKEARDLAAGASDQSHLLFRTTHNLGSSYRDSGDLRKSERFLKDSLKLAETRNVASEVALVYNSLGILYRKLGDAHEAADFFQKSLERLVLADQKFRQAQVYNNLGLAHADTREWSKSEEFFKQSLQIKRQAGDTLGQAMTLTNLVRVYRNLNLRPQAIEASHRAIQLFHEMKSLRNMATAQRNLGRLQRSLDDFDAARECFQGAIESFLAAGVSEEIAVSQKELDELRGKKTTQRKTDFPGLGETSARSGDPDRKPSAFRKRLLWGIAIVVVLIILLAILGSL